MVLFHSEGHLITNRDCVPNDDVAMVTEDEFDAESVAWEVDRKFQWKNEAT